MVKRIQMPEGQWDESFITKMQARMFVGFYRYGSTKRYAESGKYSITETIKKRLQAYIDTGNQEHLVDVANFCLIEFMYPQHKDAHFESIEEEDVTKRIGVVETLIRVDNEEEKGLRG